MKKLLDERFNEKSGLLEKVMVYIGQEGEGFKQSSELAVEKSYYLNGQIVHAEILFDYTKLENNILLNLDLNK